MDYETLADLPQILPRRVNEPPPVFFGCTLRETIAIAVISFGFWVLFAVIVGLLTGIFLVLLTASTILTLVCVYAFAIWLSIYKHGKPPGYFQHQWRLFLERWGLAVSHIYQVDGVLDTGRSVQYINKRRLTRRKPKHEIQPMSSDND